MTGEDTDPEGHQEEGDVHARHSPGRLVRSSACRPIRSTSAAKLTSRSTRTVGVLDQQPAEVLEDRDQRVRGQLGVDARSGAATPSSSPANMACGPARGRRRSARRTDVGHACGAAQDRLPGERVERDPLGHRPHRDEHRARVGSVDLGRATPGELLERARLLPVEQRAEQRPEAVEDAVDHRPGDTGLAWRSRRPRPRRTRRARSPGAPRRAAARGVPRSAPARRTGAALGHGRHPRRSSSNYYRCVVICLHGTPQAARGQPHEDYGFFGPDSVTWKVWGYSDLADSASSAPSWSRSSTRR